MDVFLVFQGRRRMDSLFCGKARLVATVHRTVAKSRLSNPICADAQMLPHAYCKKVYTNKKDIRLDVFLVYWWERMDSNHRSH